MTGKRKPGEGNLTVSGAEMRPHLASLVEVWRASVGENAVVAHRGNRALCTSYPELARLAGRFAAVLRARSVGPGARVVLWGENSAEWIAAFFGCVLRGALAVPLDAGSSPDFVRRVVAEVSPVMVVGDPGLLAQLGGALPAFNLRTMAEWLPAEPDFLVDAAVMPDAPVQIVFTSGTTGEPKGVVHTHRNILASVGPIEREMARYRRYERPFHPLRFLHTLPLSHVFGQFMGMWLPPLLRAEVHFVDSVEPVRLLGLLRRERISVLVAVPRILELLRAYLLGRFPELPERLAASAGIRAWKRWWRFRAVHRLLGWKFWALICGGATLPAELEGFWNGLGLALIQGYGMTETAALVTLNHPFRVGKGTLGKTLPGREVRLSAEGEIEVRGDVLAAGAWRGGRFQPREEEWLATGDLGVQEASGELRFAGRKGDAIVMAAGLNVYPADLEAALLRQPGVRGAAVVGCETPLGPQPVAAVLFTGAEDDLARVRDAANTELAGFQRMGHVLRWPEPAFPYTSTGKLLRRQVAEWACAQIGAGRENAVAAATAATSEAGDRLLRLIGEVTREPVRSGDGAQRLTEDLHLDSLGRVQLQSVLAERFGVEIDDAPMAAIATLGELRARVAAGSGWSLSADFLSDPPTDSPAEIGADRLPQRNDVAAPEAVRYVRWPWSAPVRWLRIGFTEVVVRGLVRALVRPRVASAGLVSALTGPVLLVANHVNTFDLPLLLYALPGAVRRRLATAMSAEVLGDLRGGRGQGSWWRNLLARPAYPLLPALFNVFPLPRFSGFRRSFAHAGQALDRGYSVLVFPEGRRSRTGGLQPFRPGIGLLVQASGVPVVPVALQGMGSAARVGGRWFRTGQVAVRFGTPLRFAEGESAEEITTRLQEALRILEPS